MSATASFGAEPDGRLGGSPAGLNFPYTFTLVYAVIRTGGKQEKVSEGQRLDVELLGKDEGDEVTFAPVLLVDGDTVLSGTEAGGSTVTARVLGETKGPKIRGFTYKSKSNQRRRWGHRQRYTTIEITAITRSGSGS